MSDGFPSLIGLLSETLRAPRDAARRILALGLPERILWEALALGALLTVILLEIMVQLAIRGSTDPETEILAELYGQPLVVTFGQAINSVVMVLAIFHLGRLFGGTGSRPGAVALVAWHQIFMLAVGLATMVVGFALPPLLPVFLIALIALYFFVLTQFVCVLHGFTNAVSVFAMVVLSMISLGVFISILTGVIAAILFGASPNV